MDPPTGGFWWFLGYLKASRNHLLGGTGIWLDPSFPFKTLASLEVSEIEEPLLGWFWTPLGGVLLVAFRSTPLKANIYRPYIVSFFKAQSIVIRNEAIFF